MPFLHELQKAVQSKIKYKKKAVHSKIKQRKTWKSGLNVQENVLSKINLTLGTLMSCEKLIHPYYFLDIQQTGFFPLSSSF